MTYLVLSKMLNLNSNQSSTDEFHHHQEFHFHMFLGEPGFSGSTLLASTVGYRKNLCDKQHRFLWTRIHSCD